jgi:2-(1,2-epoxy-1,2-dihydrophenyl)acetyl-CoA isomerase
MPELLLDIRANVARITINRPDSMNAMHSQLWPDMLELVREVEHNPEVRCILLSGAGANFCAGGDVKEFSTTIDMTPMERATFWMRSADRTNPLFVSLERIPQPVVVSCRGIAAGGGLGFVAAADLVIASETSRFFAAQIKLGAIPDSAVTYNLLRNVGVKRAKEYCFLGDTLDARTALDLGLINWVVPDDELEQRTDELLARLVKIPRIALARTKATINAAHTETLADHMVQEAHDVGACVREEDFSRNVRAFVERVRSKGKRGVTL